MAHSRLIIGGLSGLDGEELKEVLGEKVEITNQEVPEGSIAEPATIIAAITLGTVACATLALWLSKKRRKYLLKQTFKVVHPDGSQEERTLEINASSEEEVKAEVASQIGNWLGK